MRFSESRFPHRGRHSDMDWLESRTILYTVVGSRAYGTHHSGSDYDYKGICVPPQYYRDGFFHRFEQAEIREPVDSTIYDIRKFFRLAVDCNPNILDVLWADRTSIVLCTGAGQILREHRADFLSKRVLYSFRGYAMSQLVRIKRHRGWLLDSPTRKPQRSDFGLSDDSPVPTDQLNAALRRVEKKMDSWEIDFGDMEESEKIHIREQISQYLAELSIASGDKFRAAGRLVGYGDDFLGLLKREKEYRTAVGQWKRYQNWKENRNPKRAEMESRYGYDLKHALHLVRLLRMCREILQEGVVRVKRPDADELKSVLRGEWDYDSLVSWAQDQDKELIELAKKSSLPKRPDKHKLDSLCLTLTQMAQMESAKWTDIG